MNEHGAPNSRWFRKTNSDKRFFIVPKFGHRYPNQTFQKTHWVQVTAVYCE